MAKHFDYPYADAEPHLSRCKDISTLHANYPRAMASLFTPAMRPLGCFKAAIRQMRWQKEAMRPLSTYRHVDPNQLLMPKDPTKPHVNRKIKTLPPPPTPANVFKDPVTDLEAAQITALDPSGARTRFFSKTNPDGAKVGDILLVRQRNGEPFAGVCINIRRRGVDSSILLRNQLTRVGVEMWFKFYSPNVEGIEVVQRKEKRARRARLTYMRKPKHDIGSVQNIVMAYQRSKLGARNDKSGKGKGKGKR